MEYREIAKGVNVPILGLGTWGMGGRETPDKTRDAETITAIRMAVELGLTHLDTAEYYGAGHAEELVGEAIEDMDRKSLFITSKVWHNHLQRDNLLTSMKASLKRLGIDQVDLYLVHWPNPDVPLKETMATMEECVKEGYTRLIGVSNFSAQLMEEAQGCLRDNRLAVNQVQYSLLDQKPHMELLPACRRMGVSLVAYRPLERGAIIQTPNPVMDEIAKAHGKSRVQVALNWLTTQDGVFTIPKSTNPVHIMEFMGALGWRMTPEESGRLAESYR
ncbi:TPA: aldo/keto reductase [Candidatus Bathyarchaeota archaeon]|nr:aldo/keto reductase [Candidatus Bathyarchaeota archaeon]